MLSRSRIPLERTVSVCRVAARLTPLAVVRLSPAPGLAASTSQTGLARPLHAVHYVWQHVLNFRQFTHRPEPIRLVETNSCAGRWAQSKIGTQLLNPRSFVCGLVETASLIPPQTKIPTQALMVDRHETHPPSVAVIRASQPYSAQRELLLLPHTKEEWLFSNAQFAQRDQQFGNRRTQPSEELPRALSQSCKNHRQHLHAPHMASGPRNPSKFDRFLALRCVDHRFLASISMSSSRFE